MRERVTIEVGQIVPEAATVQRSLGYVAGAEPDERVAKLLAEALELLAALAAPVGLLADVSTAAFATIYEGRGGNEPVAPLPSIYPRATALALLAVTVGPAVSARIAALFADHDYALAAILDAVASEATERAADRVQQRFVETLAGRGPLSPSTGVLRYSPGYCGWHISGQQALFGALDPGEIGMTLSDTYLMQPIKSMTGVIIAGPREIHAFDNEYLFCEQCQAQGCRQRIRDVMEA